MKIFRQGFILLAMLVALTYIDVSAVLADGEESTPPDSHAPLGVMGDHPHGMGEWMMSYRFMALEMEGLRDGTELLTPDEVLKQFAVTPTHTRMHTHIFGMMFAPHNRITLMTMTSYRDSFMEMKGDATHTHTEGDHDHPTGDLEMESAGLGDLKLSALIPVLRTQGRAFILNAGVSIPTGSIAVEDNDGILPYPMQLGSGSFELIPGATFTSRLHNWSFGGQIRLAVPLNENSRGYRLGRTTEATFWGARRLNDWISVSVRALFENWGNITGSDKALKPEMAPTMDPNLQGGTRGSLLAGTNLIFPDRLGGLLAGQRFALEFRLPVYQQLDGPQMELDWTIVVGWQYTFTLW